MQIFSITQYNMLASYTISVDQSLDLTPQNYQISLF